MSRWKPLFPVLVLAFGVGAGGGGGSRLIRDGPSAWGFGGLALGVILIIVSAFLAQRWRR